jgi:hypothetical protein
MNCPKCENQMLCSCRSCDKRNLGKVRSITRSEVARHYSTGKPVIDHRGDVMRIEFERCGYCGFEMTSDEWMDYEGNRYFFSQRCLCGHIHHRDDDCNIRRCECREYRRIPSTAIMLRSLAIQT